MDFLVIRRTRQFPYRCTAANTDFLQFPAHLLVRYKSGAAVIKFCGQLLNTENIVSPYKALFDNSVLIPGIFLEPVVPLRQAM